MKSQAIGRRMERWLQQDERIEAYKAREISDRIVHDLIVRSTDVTMASASALIVRAALADDLSCLFRDGGETAGTKHQWDSLNKYHKPTVFGKVLVVKVFSTEFLTSTTL